MRTAVFDSPPEVAVIVAVVFVLTSVVLIVKVADVLPAKIVVVAGTVAEASLLDSDITRPPVGAAVRIDTVPVLELPATTDVGFKTTEMSGGGLMVNLAATETAPWVPVRVAITWAGTATVFTVNVAEVLPAGIVTVAGITAAFWLVDRLTTIPPAGAAPDKVAVPVDEDSPTTADGATVIEARAGGLMVSPAVFESVPSVDEMIATACTVTTSVLTVNVAEF